MALRDLWYKIKSTPLRDVIKHKHRFVVMDTDTFKEKFSFQLSGINLFVAVGATFIILILLTTILIAFTPLREYIPGYTNTSAVEQTYLNAKRLDSLEKVTDDQEWLITTLQAILRGEPMGSEADSLMADSSSTFTHVAAAYHRSVDDSLLRIEVENDDNPYELRTQRNQASSQEKNAAPHIFFAPVKGETTNPFSPTNHHFGIDIAAPQGKPVGAAYSGTVIFSGFAADEGYIIALQHPAGIITIYRNNESLLKHQGDAVKTGEPIAYVGAAAGDNQIPHLHLEVWVNGTPANPEDYITF